MEPRARPAVVRFRGVTRPARSKRRYFSFGLAFCVYQWELGAAEKRVCKKKKTKNPERHLPPTGPR